MLYDELETTHATHDGKSRAIIPFANLMISGPVESVHQDGLVIVAEKPEVIAGMKVFYGKDGFAVVLSPQTSPSATEGVPQDATQRP